jgi:hypothetical protein
MRRVGGADLSLTGRTMMSDNLREKIEEAGACAIDVWALLLDRIECLEACIRSHDSLLSTTPNGTELVDAQKRVAELAHILAIGGDSVRAARAEAKVKELEAELLLRAAPLSQIVHILPGHPAPEGEKFVTMDARHYDQWRRCQKRELAELTADKARLDWLESLSSYSAGYTAWKIRDGQLVRSITTEYTHETVREAIDAARKGDKP